MYDCIPNKKYPTCPPYGSMDPRIVYPGRVVQQAEIDQKRACTRNTFTMVKKGPPTFLFLCLKEGLFRSCVMSLDYVSGLAVLHYSKTSRIGLALAFVMTRKKRRADAT